MNKKLVIISIFCMLVGCVQNGGKTIKSKQEKILHSEASQVCVNVSYEYDYSSPVKKSRRVEDEFFNDAVFIGDSRVEGMNNYKTLAYSTREVYAATSLDLNKVEYMKVIQLDNGQMGTLIEALNQKKFGKIYISFGLNEIGWKSEEVFMKKYTQLIENVKSIQPQADLYLLGVYPFAYSVNLDHYYTTIDRIDWLNQMIRQIANDNHVYWLDTAKMIPDGEKYLPDEWTHDGYHLNSDGYRNWVEYLKHHVVIKGEEIHESQKHCLD